MPSDRTNRCCFPLFFLSRLLLLPRVFPWPVVSAESNRSQFPFESARQSNRVQSEERKRVTHKIQKER